MTPNELDRIGEILYGPCYQKRLAAALPVGERHFRRWVNGELPVPEWMGKELLKVCGQRLDELEALFDQLEQEIDK